MAHLVLHLSLLVHQVKLHLLLLLLLLELGLVVCLLLCLRWHCFGALRSNSTRSHLVLNLFGLESIVNLGTLEATVKGERTTNSTKLLFLGISSDTRGYMRLVILVLVRIIIAAGEGCDPTSTIHICVLFVRLQLIVFWLCFVVLHIDHFICTVLTVL